jgi:hypothetical protein
MPFVFIPVLWLAPAGRRIKSAALYLGHMFLAYVLVGFPQNLNLPRTLRFLSSQAGSSEAASLASVIEWVQLWGAQLIGPLALCVLLLGAARLRQGQWKRPESWKHLLFMAGLAFGPFILMLPQHVLVPHTHYLMPILATQLVLLLSLAPRFFGPVGLGARWALLALLLGTLSWLHLTPSHLNEVLQKQLTCRPEARAVFQRLLTYQEKGRSIYVDPYVPTMDHSGIFSSWQTNKALIGAKNFDVLVLRRDYYKAYLTLTDKDIRYLSSDSPGYLATSEFYKLFAGQDTVADPIVGHWQNVSRDACTWEIWEKAHD